MDNDLKRLVFELTGGVSDPGSIQTFFGMNDKIISELKFEIRGILLSAAHDGVKLQELERDYADLNGRPLPFRQFGYQNIVQFLHDKMSDVCSFFQDRFGSVVLFPVSHESTRHIEKLIAGQRHSKTSRLGGALQQPPHLLSKNAGNRNAHARQAATAFSSRVARGGSVGGRLAAMNKRPTVQPIAPVAPATKKAVASFSYTSAAQNVNQTMPSISVARTTVNNLPAPIVKPPPPMNDLSGDNVPMVPPHARVPTNEHFLISPSANRAHVPPPIATPRSAPTPIVATQTTAPRVVPDSSGSMMTPESFLKSVIPSSTQTTRLKASSLMMASAKGRLPPASNVPNSINNSLNKIAPASPIVPIATSQVPTIPTVAPSADSLKLKFLQAPGASTAKANNGTLLLSPSKTRSADSSATNVNFEAPKISFSRLQQTQSRPTIYPREPFTESMVASSSKNAVVNSTVVFPPIKQEPQAPAKIDKLLLSTIHLKNPALYEEFKRNCASMLGRYSRRGIRLSLFSAAYDQYFTERGSAFILNAFGVSWRELVLSLGICYIDKNDVILPQPVSAKSRNLDHAVLLADRPNMTVNNSAEASVVLPPGHNQTTHNSVEKQSNLRQWINATHGESSSQQKSNVLAQNVINERERVKNNLRQVISTFTNGIRPHDFAKEYSRVVGEALNLDVLDVYSVVELVQVLPEIFMQDVRGNFLPTPACQAKLQQDRECHIVQFISQFFVEVLQAHPDGILWTQVRDIYENRFRQPTPVQNWELVTYVTQRNIDVFHYEHKGERACLWKLNDVNPASISCATLSDGYLEQSLPEDAFSEEPFEAFVMQCYSPDNFYIQIYEYQSKLTKLMRDLNEEINTADRYRYLMNTRYVKKGMPCAAYYAPEGWHRAIISDVRNVNDISCDYIDYGTKVESIRISRLRFLPKQFLSLPAQAIPCTLARIKQKDGQEYSAEAISKFEALSLDKLIWVTLVRVEEMENSKTCHVILTITNGEDDLHVNDFLIKEGYAVESDERKTLNSRMKGMTLSNSEEVLSDDDFQFQTPPDEMVPSTSALPYESAKSTLSREYSAGNNHAEELQTGDDLLDSEDEELFLNGAEDEGDSSHLYPDLEIQISLMRKARSAENRSNTNVMIVNRTLLSLQRNKYVRQISNGDDSTHNLVDKINWLEKQLKWLEQRIKIIQNNAL